MTYEQVNPIHSVELAAPASPPVQITKKPQVKAASRVETPAPENKPEVTASKPQVIADNVSLKFIVDNESNNITVLVLDKSSNKIIRAIPPEELNNFKEGDLLSLFV